MAFSLRQGIVQEFTNDHVEIPERREILGYAPVADCEKLVVSWDRIWVGQAGGSETVQPVNRAILRTCTLAVWLFRGITVPLGEQLELTELPAIEDLDADARKIMVDALTLHRGISRSHLANEFTDFCTALAIGPATPIPPAGGIAGTTLQVMVELV